MHTVTFKAPVSVSHFFDKSFIGYYVGPESSAQKFINLEDLITSLQSLNDDDMYWIGDPLSKSATIGNGIYV